MLLDNFVSNKELIRSIRQIFIDQKSSQIYCYGSSGNGKTHLLQGAVLESLANDKNAVFIDCSDSFPDHLVEFIDQISLISFDNIHLLSNKNEEVFFDLLNRFRQSQVNILISGDSLPIDLNIMKDIKTRLSLATVFKLEELNDQQTMSVIERQMSYKNLTIDSKVYKYLFTNYSRDLKVLLLVMDNLDKLSLQSKQAISIPFVKKILKI